MSAVEHDVLHWVAKKDWLREILAMSDRCFYDLSQQTDQSERTMK